MGRLPHDEIDASFSLVTRRVRWLIFAGMLAELTVVSCVAYFGTIVITNALWGGWTIATRWESAGVLIAVIAIVYGLLWLVEGLVAAVLAERVLKRN
jgi:hypothetical protein